MFQLYNGILFMNLVPVLTLIGSMFQGYTVKLPAPH
ncbi:Protein of unknown function [Bacillus mycoides]|uniref:Uncharacterized protein n=1 Tax=Bacillus mycoides TaxID=1405 RepID=A0A1G4EX50_BACMY|nr:Protein of unknown function [Bacillus mycoides]